VYSTKNLAYFISKNVEVEFSLCFN